MPRLEKITAGNLDAALAVSVRPDQLHAVDPVVKSLAEPYVHRTIAGPRVIRDGDRAVGFLMAFFGADLDEGRGNPDLRSGQWRLNIDAREQGRGYGRFAVESVAAELRRRGGTLLTTTWHPGRSGPEDYYRALGFRTNGEMSGDQVVGELRLA